MNWSDERYVRVYTRDTYDLLAVGWEGRLVLYELLRKCDRAGVLATGGDLAVIPELLRIPVDIFERGIERLKKRGTVVVSEESITIPNYLAAQEAKYTTAARQRQSRQTRAERAAANGEDPRIAARPDRYGPLGVTPRDHMGSQDVTNGSHGVTAGHSGSLHTVPYLAVPYCTQKEHSSVEPSVAQVAPEKRWTPNLEPVYAAYPRKEGKSRGIGIAKRSIRTPEELELLSKAVANYTRMVVGKEKQFIKQFGTFMGCWRDYLDAAVVAEGEPLASGSSLPVNGARRPVRDNVTADDLFQMAEEMRIRREGA